MGSNNRDKGFAKVLLSGGMKGRHEGAFPLPPVRDSATPLAPQSEGLREQAIFLIFSPSVTHFTPSMSPTKFFSGATTGSTATQHKGYTFYSNM